MRPLPRFRLACTAVALLLGLVACNSPAEPAAQPVPNGSVPDPFNLPGSPGATPTGTGGAAAGTSSPGPGGGAPSPDYTSPGASPAPFEAPWESTIGVEARIAPSCVEPGGTVRITITTVPQAAVAYHALYSGTKGGAAPPYGSGYGGNDKGFADENGRYSDSWVVSPDAPEGPARADVVVSDGNAWGYDDPPFWVSATSAGCP